MQILRFRLRAILGLATAVTLLLVTFGISGTRSAAAASNTAEDTFARADTTAGWGTTTNADGLSNLPWQGNFGSSSLTVINSGAGRIDVTTNAHPLSGFLGVPSNAGGNVLGEVSFSAVGHGAAGLLLQRISANQWYEAVLDTSKKQLQLIRRTGGTSTVVGTPMSFTAAAGTNYWLRLDAVPSGGSEVISARIWPDGTAEPASWQTTYTDPTPLTAGQPGALGIWYSGPGAADHMDFHAFAYAPSGLATAPSTDTAPAFTTDSPPAGATVGTSYSYTFAASGSPAPTFSVASGTLPADLSLDPGSGILSGTPSATGSFSFTVQAANGVSPAAVSPTVTITVSAATPTAPAITSASSATATTTTAMNFTVTTTGPPTPTITESGALPGGVSFTDNGDGTASIAGTPASGTEGSYPITITASNGISPDASQAFTLTVNGLAPAFIAGSPPATAVTGASYSYTFTASGDPAPTFSVASGTLPTGLSLDPGSGILSGTASATGSFSFTVQAANGISPAATTPALQIIVNASGTTTSNTAEDDFQRANSKGWGTTTNNDGSTNYAWQRDLASGQPYSDISNDNGIITYTGSNGHKAAGSVPVPANRGGDVLEEIEFSAIGHQLGGEMLQVTGGSYWYQADLNTSTGVINLVKRNAGVMNWVASTPFVAAANTPYWIRLDVQPVGSTEVVNARVWANGTPEPTTWMVTWTDTSPLAAGQAGAMGDWPRTPAAGEEIQYLNWAYAATGLAVPAS